MLCGEVGILHKLRRILPCGPGACLLAIVPALLLSVMILRSVSADPSIPVYNPEREADHRLRIFDQDGASLGIGNYRLHTTPGGITRIEFFLDVRKGEYVRQVVEVRQADVLLPVSFAHEHIDNETKKSFRIDFRSGYVESRIECGGETERRSGHLEFDRHKTFAGVMFILVALNFPKGAKEIGLNSVLFDPELKVVRVNVREAGVEKIEIENRLVPAVKYVVKPDLPAVLRLLVGDSFDQTIWLSAEDRSFLRFEGSLESGGRFCRVQ
jgi:hypothetical protein